MSSTDRFIWRRARRHSFLTFDNLKECVVVTIWEDEFAHWTLSRILNSTERTLKNSRDQVSITEEKSWLQKMWFNSSENATCSKRSCIRRASAAFINEGKLGNQYTPPSIFNLPSRINYMILSTYHFGCVNLEGKKNPPAFCQRYGYNIMETTGSTVCIQRNNLWNFRNYLLLPDTTEFIN